MTATIAYLIFPEWIAQAFLKFAGSLALKSDDYSYLFDQFVPELKDAIKGVKGPSIFVALPPILGMAIKITYAFTYQEEKIPIDFPKT